MTRHHPNTSRGGGACLHHRGRRARNLVTGSPRLSDRADVARLCPVGETSSAVPAGWYPDPAGSGQQRYFDGSVWTDRYAPYPPPTVAQTGAGGFAIPPAQPLRTVVTGPNHVMHAVLTLLTFWAWWMGVGVVGSGVRQSPASGDGGRVRQRWSAAGAVRPIRRYLGRRRRTPRRRAAGPTEAT